MSVCCCIHIITIITIIVEIIIIYSTVLMHNQFNVFFMDLHSKRIQATAFIFCCDCNLNFNLKSRCGPCRGLYGHCNVFYWFYPKIRFRPTFIDKFVAHIRDVAIFLWRIRTFAQKISDIVFCICFTRSFVLTLFYF